MVISENGIMLSSAANNQYLQPDYLSPLPIENLDAKKSPLALLAQTCSQIGVDTPSLKGSLSSSEKSKKMCSNNSYSSPILCKDKCEKICPQLTSAENKLVFKPYEDHIINKKKEDNRSSKCPLGNIENKSEFKGRKSSSPTYISNSHNSESYKALAEGKTTNDGSDKYSGIEALPDNSKELSYYEPDTPTSGFSSTVNPVYCPPGVEHMNPAFRSQFSGVTFTNQQSGGFASGYISSPLGTYVTYGRVKAHAGGESLMPVCKDPYCTGCHLNMPNQQLLNGGTSGPCSSNCSQCDHQKYNLAMAMSLASPSHSSASALTYMQLGRPYICNWIADDTYCGKRFATSEDLLQHLRTHTNESDSNSVTTTTSSLLNSHPLFSSTILHRSGYSNPQLSPISTRYHPYGKPTLPVSLVASPYSAFSPMAVVPYYSVYSVYGRMGVATAHP